MTKGPLVHCSTLATSMEKEKNLEIKKEEDEQEGTENSEEDDCYEIDLVEFYGKLAIDISSDADKDDEVDVVVLYTKGPVALRDFPHPRHLCGNFPFDSTPHEKHCSNCYCVLCEVVAPCSNWNGSDAHCNVISNNCRNCYQSTPERDYFDLWE